MILKLGLVKGVPPYVYIERVPGANRLPSEGLRPCAPGEPPDLILRKPPVPQSVFRGMVKRGQVVASDVLQVWLDVWAHPARGQEQADLILRRVLRPIIQAEA